MIKHFTVFALLVLISFQGDAQNMRKVLKKRTAEVGLFGAVGYDDVEVQLDLETLDLKHQTAIMDMLDKSKFRFSKLD